MCHIVNHVQQFPDDWVLYHQERLVFLSATFPIDVVVRAIFGLVVCTATYIARAHIKAHSLRGSITVPRPRVRPTSLPVRRMRPVRR